MAHLARFKQRRKKLKRQNRKMLAIERVLSGEAPATTSGLTAKDLANAFEAVSKEPLRTTPVYMSQQEWDDISKDGTYVTSFDEAPPTKG